VLVWYILSSCVCMSVSVSYASIVSKQLNLELCKCCMIVQGLYSFLVPKIPAKSQTSHCQQGYQMQVKWIKISDIQQMTDYNLKMVQDRF